MLLMDQATIESISPEMRFELALNLANAKIARNQSTRMEDLANIAGAAAFIREEKAREAAKNKPNAPSVVVPVE